MKVRVLVEFSDHRRPHYAVDEVVELEDATQRIAQGLAEAVVEHEPPEAATLEPEENTALPRARKRRA